MEKELREKMNKLRQVKDSVYSNEKEKNCLFNLKDIEKLINEHPNDYDLGNKIRQFYLESIGRLN